MEHKFNRRQVYGGTISEKVLCLYNQIERLLSTKIERSFYAKFTGNRAGRYQSSDQQTACRRIWNSYCSSVILMAGYFLKKGLTFAFQNDIIYLGFKSEVR